MNKWMTQREKKMSWVNKIQADERDTMFSCSICEQWLITPIKKEEQHFTTNNNQPKNNNSHKEKQELLCPNAVEPLCWLLSLQITRHYKLRPGQGRCREIIRKTAKLYLTHSKNLICYTTMTSYNILLTYVVYFSNSCLLYCTALYQSM
jgi:hypothetical protein